MVAVAVDGKNNVWVQTRDPFRIGSLQGSLLAEYGYGSAIRFTIGESHRLFHTPTVAGIACASCHPEGGDDGFTWSFDAGELRRSMSLRGGFRATAPFHWPGDLADFPALALTIFGRMRLGYQLDSTRIDTLATWLDQLPLLPGRCTLTILDLPRP